MVHKYVTDHCNSKQKTINITKSVHPQNYSYFHMQQKDCKFLSRLHISAFLSHLHSIFFLWIPSWIVKDGRWSASIIRRNKTCCMIRVRVLYFNLFSFIPLNKKTNIQNSCSFILDLMMITFRYCYTVCTLGTLTLSSKHIRNFKYHWRPYHIRGQRTQPILVF